MRRVPGVSLPRPSCCRRLPFPTSPWRWPNQPPRRSQPSHTHEGFVVHPPTPATGSTEGRSFPKRPAFSLPTAMRVRNAGNEKGDGNAVAFPIVERALVGLGAELVVAGAAGLAGVGESRRQRFFF